MFIVARHTILKGTYDAFPIFRALNTVAMLNISVKQEEIATLHCFSLPSAFYTGLYDATLAAKYS